MSRLNRSVALRYRMTRRRRQAYETERVVFQEIGQILVKLSVEHAQAVQNWRGFLNSCGRCGRPPRRPQLDVGAALRRHVARQTRRYRAN